MALSTTHVATGSILGTGLGKRGAQVRWGTAGRMVVAWVITLPAAALVGALCWYLAHGIGGGIGVTVVFAVLIAAATLIFRHSRKTKVSHENVNADWQGGLAPVDVPAARRATADLSA
jgi:PiT family inorganic phosphate transporter